MEEENYVTVKEACRQTGAASSTIYGAINSGAVKSQVKGRVKHVEMGSLNEFLRRVLLIRTRIIKN